MTAALSYALRWCLWLVRWMLFAVYGGLLTFISKPGSRVIVPALAAPVAYAHRLQLVRLVVLADWRGMSPETLLPVALALLFCVAVMLAPARAFLLPAIKLLLVAALALAVLQYSHWQGFDIAAHIDMKTAIIDAIVGLELALAASVYVALSHVLVLLLGAFPPMVRPLRPLRALRVRNRIIRPVAVRLAVPKLPKRREQAS